MRPSSDPLAYFITFSTYGTWLHGDERGSVLRHRGTTDPSGLLPPRPALERYNRSEMDQPPYHLDPQRRGIVLATALEVARHRGWKLLAIHVRSNHVHCVIHAGTTPEKVMNDIKAYASRRLNEARLDGPGRKRWTRHGSTLHLWSDEAVWEKVWYTAEEQGEQMALYVAPEYALPSKARP